MSSKTRWIRAGVLIAVACGALSQSLPGWRNFVVDVKGQGFHRRQSALASGFDDFALKTAAEITGATGPNEPVGLFVPCGNDVLGIHLRYLVAPRPVHVITTGFPEACAVIAKNRLAVVHALRCPGDPASRAGSLSGPSGPPRDGFARVDVAGICGGLNGLVDSLGKLDEGIPVAVDAPVDGATVAAGPLLVRGWCQDWGGLACSEIRFFVDGMEVPPASFKRFPRPDVAAVLPRLGDTSTAGYEALLPAQAAGRRTLVVFFRLPDGRMRRQSVALEVAR